MEAANRGAADAGGKSIGLNIGLPHEQRPNDYISPGLAFEFHYFFMRKLWFAHLARALVVFPGGFGTLDELMEILTLMQTEKIDRRIPVILYGSAYWNEVINFEALVRHGMIERQDLALFRFADDPASALALLQSGMAPPTETRNARHRALAHNVIVQGGTCPNTSAIGPGGTNMGGSNGASCMASSPSSNTAAVVKMTSAAT